MLFGTIEGDEANGSPRSSYDIVATAIGPRENLVTQRKRRMFGIWVNAKSRTFANVPSYVSVMANRRLAAIADPDTLARDQIGVAQAALPHEDASAGAAAPFRDALLHIKGEHGLYSESDNAVTFLDADALPRFILCRRNRRPEPTRSWSSCSPTAS